MTFQQTSSPVSAICQDLIEKQEWEKIEIGDSKKNIFATTWCYTKMKLM